MSQSLSMGAVSRSYQYRKVMKPLLERKRRARINRCLEQLKVLIMQLVQLVGTVRGSSIDTVSFSSFISAG